MNNNRAQIREETLRQQLLETPRRIVIGASGVFEPAWTPTDAREFDLLRPETWERFVQPGSIDCLMAEHVWEHLTLEQGRTAALTCHRFLKPGGYLRVAVPDGLFPSAEFQEYIKIGGKAGGGVVGGRPVRDGGGHQQARSDAFGRQWQRERPARSPARPAYRQGLLPARGRSDHPAA